MDLRNKIFIIAFIASCLFNMVGQVQAEENFVQPNKLKNYGIDVENVLLTGFSHDKSFIMMYQPNTPKKKLQGLGYKFFLLKINPGNNQIESVKTYEVPVTRWEYSMLTPDQKEIIIITKAGATFLKLNLETGQVSTLLENVIGEAGFRAYPQILHMVDGEIFCTGYFHDAEGYCDVDCNAWLDLKKTGVAAFKRVHDVQGMVVKMSPKAWTFTRPNLGFFYAIPKDEPNKAIMLTWNPPAISKPGIFDVGRSVRAMWGSRDRLLYTIQREDETYDLVIYDANTRQKTFIDRGSKDMYFNLFMSNDGNTALFTDTAHRINTAAYFYADQRKNWQLTPVADFHGRAKPFGEIRISDDGEKMVINSKKGLIIANIK